MGNQNTKPSEITQVSILPNPINKTLSIPKCVNTKQDVPISSLSCQLPNSFNSFIQSFSSSFKQKSLDFFKSQENLIITCERIEKTTSSTFINQSQRLSLLVTKQKNLEIQANFSTIKSSINDLKSEIESLESLIYKLDDLLISSPVKKN